MKLSSILPTYCNIYKPHNNIAALRTKKPIVYEPSIIKKQQRWFQIKIPKIIIIFKYRQILIARYERIIKVSAMEKIT